MSVAEENLNRWRLILGRNSENQIEFTGEYSESISYQDMEETLDYLYSQEYGEEVLRKGGTGKSQLNAAKWIEKARNLFPKKTVEIIEKQALDHFKMTELLTDKEVLKKTGAVLLALVFWQAVSMIVGMEMLLASPLRVLERLSTIWREKDFLSTVLFSLLRIFGGFLLAFLVGILLALLAGRFRTVEILLWPYVVTIKSVPIASFIILCLIWFSYTQMTVFISFLIAFPVIYSNVLHGIRSTDPQMLEMAKLYKVRGLRKLFYIQLPGIMPFLASACSVAIGMAWKAGVAAEVIGVINGSIGQKLYDAKIYFQNADLLSWTLIIILLSVAGEKLFVRLLTALYGKAVSR